MKLNTMSFVTNFILVRLQNDFAQKDDWAIDMCARVCVCLTIVLRKFDIIKHTSVKIKYVSLILLMMQLFYAHTQ